MLVVSAFQSQRMLIPAGDASDLFTSFPLGRRVDWSQFRAAPAVLFGESLVAGGRKGKNKSDCSYRPSFTIAKNSRIR